MTIDKLVFSKAFLNLYKNVYYHNPFRHGCTILHHEFINRKQNFKLAQAENQIIFNSCHHARGLNYWRVKKPL